MQAAASTIPWAGGGPRGRTVRRDGCRGCERGARGEPHQLLVGVPDGQAQHQCTGRSPLSTARELLREQRVRSQSAPGAGFRCCRACAGRRVPSARSVVLLMAAAPFDTSG
ncbi:hypothetical protein Sviol_29390 [Streptomyces violascens]|uniref:Uncharacterized protein n=1 Tax=Streptomyces violascens TaxID=67381 RepID=A0ABQ3QMN2_9ACTN|nr:hypothetical protein Sviol_29390 [Streptomyces violascens]